MSPFPEPVCNIIKILHIEFAEDGEGIGQGDHFLPDKFFKRSFEYGTTSTKPLNAGRGHQTPSKAAHSLKNEIGQNIKHLKKERETKELGTEIHPREGVMKKFPNSRKPSHRKVWGYFCNLRGQHNWEGKALQNM